MKNRSTGRLSLLFFNVVIPECFYRGSQPLKNTTRFPITTFGNDARRRYVGGFTLIELLVVVLILGILSAVALPQYRVAVEKSRVSEAMTVIKSIAQAREVYRLANGELPIYFRDIDIQIPGEEDDEGRCMNTKNWGYCIDVNSTDAGRNNVSDENYYVISYYLPSDSDTAVAGKFTCMAYGDFPDKICKSLGGKQRGGFYNAEEYVLP